MNVHPSGKEVAGIHEADFPNASHFPEVSCNPSQEEAWSALEVDWRCDFPINDSSDQEGWARALEIDSLKSQQLDPPH